MSNRINFQKESIEYQRVIDSIKTLITQPKTNHSAFVTMSRDVSEKSFGTVSQFSTRQKSDDKTKQKILFDLQLKKEIKQIKDQLVS